VLTCRAGVEACRQVGELARPVSGVADELGVCWWTVMHAVERHGRPLVDDPDRVGPVSSLGVDETSFLKANREHPTIYATGLVDLDGKKVIDMVEGNAARDLRRWCAGSDRDWLAGIHVVATDLAESYRAGLRPHLDHAVRVADPFHVVRVANRCLDTVRRRVQNELLGHRGRKHDPLYRIRKLLLSGSERLDERASSRMLLGLRLGDPDDHVLGTWLAKESVRDVYLTDDPNIAAVLLDKAIVGCLADEVPEIRSLGNTLKRWRSEILAHHETGASNGPTEGIAILRGTGMRLGELLDLELDCLWDTTNHGTWVKVPVGKLGTERTVPLDSTTLGAFDAWMAHRGRQRPLAHLRDGYLADFLFMERGRRPTAYRLRHGLGEAAAAAGLKGRGGAPLRVTPHQLRHTYATTLVNAGMSLQALMAVMGHVSPEMTLRYASIASPTVRAAYEAAMGKVRARSALVVAPAGRSAVPERLDWLRSEMLKTRVDGYCSRELVAEACPYANICEQCENFVTSPEFGPALEAQLVDVAVLRDDARARGWDSEAVRHERVIASIEGHLRRLKNSAARGSLA